MNSVERKMGGNEGRKMRKRGLYQAREWKRTWLKIWRLKTLDDIWIA